MVSVGRARLGAGPAADRPYVMRRQRRPRLVMFRLTAAVLAVVVWAAVSVLWVRSYWRGDHVSRWSRGGWFEVHSSRGDLWFTRGVGGPYRRESSYGSAPSYDGRASKRAMA